MVQLVNCVQWLLYRNICIEQSHSSKGELFLNHDGIQKINVNQLSVQICKLILEADPNTKTRVHDVRKYASSYSLAETMLVGDLVSSIHWSSPTIFFKFYLTPTDPLVLPVSLPGVTTSRVSQEVCSQ